MYCRMVIGECFSGHQVGEFVRLFEEERSRLKEEPGALNPAECLVEEGGSLVVIITYWDSRDSCLRYHASRSYRQLVAKTQHLLVGDFVVKIFRCESPG